MSSKNCVNNLRGIVSETSFSNNSRDKHPKTPYNFPQAEKILYEIGSKCLSMKGKFLSLRCGIWRVCWMWYEFPSYFMKPTKRRSCIVYWSKILLIFLRGSFQVIEQNLFDN